MKLSAFGSNTHNITYKGEAQRLANELRARPAVSYIDRFGIRHDVPAKIGFNVETSDFIPMVNWIANKNIKKSASLLAFVHRILSVRFPNEYANHKSKIDKTFLEEFDLIKSESKNDIAWFGEVGFQNKVRLDNSLNNPRSKIKRSRLGKLKVVGIDQ